jgi:AbiV family abortive infection protein
LPSPSDSVGGARAAARNARRLLAASSAVGSSDAPAYGPGISLAILAGEEAIKALTLLAWSEKLPIPTEDQLRLILRGHDARYLAAGVVVGAVETVGALIAGFFARFAAKGDTREEQRSELSEAAWWAQAGELKNRGLYIGWDGYRWTLPESLTADDFARAYRFASRLVDSIEGFLEDASAVSDAATPNRPGGGWAPLFARDTQKSDSS